MLYKPDILGKIRYATKKDWVFLKLDQFTEPLLVLAKMSGFYEIGRLFYGLINIKITKLCLLHFEIERFAGI
jgi:hypothetical protein